MAGEHGPYLLVGHSIGGPYALTYAAQHPQQVAGMVLLDSSSPEQFSAIPSYAGQYAVVHRGHGADAHPQPARSRPPHRGGHLLGAADGRGRPGGSPDGERPRRPERERRVEILPTLFRQAQALTTLDNRPLAVLTATESLHKTGGWAAAQSRLAALSTTDVHQVVDSTHAGLLEDQHGSAAAVGAIDHVIAAVRSHSALGSR